MWCRASLATTSLLRQNPAEHALHDPVVEKRCHQLLPEFDRAALDTPGEQRAAQRHLRDTRFPTVLLRPSGRPVGGICACTIAPGKKPVERGIRTRPLIEFMGRHPWRTPLHANRFFRRKPELSRVLGGAG